jgi:hypothetical protein
LIHPNFEARQALNATSDHAVAHHWMKI